MFIGLMIWSSGSMVFLLHRYHQRVQYIHTPTDYHKWPPDSRATQTILMLVVTFVIFYVLDSISIYGCCKPLMFWLHVFPLFPPSCCSLGILEHLGSVLELLETMVKVLNM
eukprot:bmy_21469T0